MRRQWGEPSLRWACGRTAPRASAPRPFPAIRSTPTTVPKNISADYTRRLSSLASVLALLVEARQPTIVWGPPGAAKLMSAQQVVTAANRRYVDVRALLLDPVDLRGILWRDGADRTRWAPPAFQHGRRRGAKARMGEVCVSNVQRCTPATLRAFAMCWSFFR